MTKNVSKPKLVALNLGSGRDYRKGWTNIDNKKMYQGDFPVDIESDIYSLEWKANSVDFILLNHVIQYFQPEELEILLNRWLGWLKVGGSIYIEAGDILSVCRSVLESKDVEQLNGKDCIMQLYGIDSNIWNKWAWTPASLTPIMAKVGFQNLYTSKGYFHKNPTRDFLTVGYKGNETPPLIPHLII